MTRCLVLLSALMLLCAATGADAAGTPLVRVVKPARTPLLVGQQAGIEVQVLVPNFFMSAPQFPPLDIPGAVVTLPDDPALNFTESVGGQTYAGIRKSYLIVPQQPGTFTLPSASIGFSYAAVPGQRTNASVSLPPETFEAVLPPGARGPNGALPVTPLVVTQVFDRDPGGLKAGDTLTRTVSISAESLPAMMIPPPDFAAPEGVELYRHDPVLSDEKRGGGRRTDRVSYVFPQAGGYVLPAVAVDWYDVAAGKTEVARAPEVKVAVSTAAAPVAIAPEAPIQPVSAWLETFDWAFWLPRGLGALVIVALSGVFWLRYGPQMLASIAARRQAAQQSESASFERLLAACRTKERMAAYRALGSWARRAGLEPLDAWMLAFGNAALRVEMERLERDLFSAAPAQGDWNSRPFETALRKARKAWLAPEAGTRKPVLLGLNPWDVSMAATGHRSAPHRQSAAK